MKKNEKSWSRYDVSCIFLSWSNALCDFVLPQDPFIFELIYLQNISMNAKKYNSLLKWRLKVLGYKIANIRCSNRRKICICAWGKLNIPNCFIFVYNCRENVSWFPLSLERYSNIFLPPVARVNKSFRRASVVIKKPVLTDARKWFSSAPILLSCLKASFDR